MLLRLIMLALQCFQTDIDQIVDTTVIAASYELIIIHCAHCCTV